MRAERAEHDRCPWRDPPTVRWRQLRRCRAPGTNRHPRDACAGVDRAEARSVGEGRV